MQVFFRYLFFLSIFCLVAVSLSAQQSSIDKAYTYKNAKNWEALIALSDSVIQDKVPGNKARFFLSKANALYYLNQPDSSLENYLKALSQHNKEPFDSLKYLLDALTNTAYSLSAKGKYEEALLYSKRTVDISIESGDSSQIAIGLSGLGVDYFRLEKYAIASDYFYRAYKIDSARRDTIGLSYDYSYLGAVNMRLKDYENAIDFYEKAVVLAKSVKADPQLYHIRLGNLADAYLKNDQLDLAYEVNTKAIKEAKLLDNQISLAKKYITHSQILNQKGKLPEARDYAADAYQYFVAEDQSAHVALAALIYAGALIALEKYQQAYVIVDKTLSDYGEQTSTSNLSGLYEKKAILLERRGDIGLALQAWKQYWELKNQLNEVEREMALEELDEKYQSSQKTQKIELLEGEKELAEARIENEKRYRFIIGLIAVILLILFSGALILYRNRRRNIALLQDRNVALEELNNTRNRLFAIVSHDLKNPVSAFRGMTAALVENYEQLKEDKALRYLEKMSRNATAVENQLNDLLLWASQQIKKEEVVTSRIDISNLTDEVLELVYPMAEQKEITLESDIDPDFSLTSHPEMLKTVIRNLVTNAIKFTRKGGLVRLEAHMKDGFPSIRIKDTGIGMTPEEVSLLFDIARSADIGTHRSKGTGIGLSICRDIIEKLDGKINVESRVNEGTVFSLNFVT